MSYFEHNAAKAGIPAKAAKPVSNREPRSEYSANRAIVASKRST